VRSDVAVKLFGDDMDVLNKTAAQNRRALARFNGATEVKVEQTTGLPMLTMNIDREKTARYGLNVGDVQDAIATAIGGQEAGTLFDGDRRFDIIVRCRSICAPTWSHEAAARLRCPVRVRAANTVRASFRWAKWPRWNSRPARTRSAAKTASAAS
jgi:Cu/Ag efflux pump CusA